MATDNYTNKNGQIRPGLRSDVMRANMENKDLLDSKGSIYVGTGEKVNSSINANETVETSTTAALTRGADGTVLMSSDTATNGLEYNKLQDKNFDTSKTYGITVQNAVNATNATTADSASAAVSGSTLDTTISNMQTTISNNYSTLDTKINAAASGGPKGTYNTVADLTVAYPNGNSNIYLITVGDSTVAAGHWVYWNGTAWTDGGEYQATEIPDESITTYMLQDQSVTPDKTSFFEIAKNKFDPENITNGYYLSRGNGNENINAAYFISNYIPVKYAEDYICNKYIFSVALYDGNKNNLGNQYTTDFAAETVININKASAKFLRFSTALSNLNELQFELGTEITDYTEYYKPRLNNVSYPVDTNNIIDKAVTPSKTSFAQLKNNFINPSNLELNKYWAPNGNFVTGTYVVGYNEPIQLSPNTRYTFNFTIADTHSYLCLSDQTDLISITLDGNSFTTDDSHVYLLLTISDTSVKEYGLYQGDVSNFIYYGYDMTQVNLAPQQLYVGASREMKTLKEGIELACKIPNTTLIVDGGEYDLVSEFGQEYLDGTSSDNGLLLYNGIHIIFSSNSKVLFNYNGDNSYIHTNFSPFNSGKFGFTIENLNLECSNCRYCIHDERGNSKDTYINKYINCNMALDNSANPDWTNPQNIGGGLGQDGYIEIEGCIFNNAVTYHNDNGTSTSSQSKIIIKNNYFSNNGIIISGYGNSLNASTIIVTGNSLKALTVNTDTAANVNVIQWNNIIRED